MLVRKITFFLSLILVLILTMPTMAVAKTLFEMEDPIGDSVGDGGYTYPLLEELGDKPSEMLDLTHFMVKDLGDKIEFRLSFALEPDYVNPFGGQGFNFHRIDIYLVTGDGGKKETFRTGANVKFDTPWNKLVRIVDWNQSRVFSAKDNPADPNAGTGISDQFIVELQDKDIVATISKGIVGEIDQSTQYYVLVGIQDALGPDQYLSVENSATRYVGGGGDDSNLNPNLYDILARSPEEQFEQLGSWRKGKPVVLLPVGGTNSGRTFKFAIISLLAAVAGVVYFLIKRR